MLSTLQPESEVLRLHVPIGLSDCQVNLKNGMSPLSRDGKSLLLLFFSFFGDYL